MGGAVLNWCWDGFNGTLIAVGASGVGKTRAIFGVEAKGGAVCVLLNGLFGRLGSCSADAVVGVSVWEVLGDRVVDLLGAEPGGIFRTVRVMSAVQALEVLHAGLGRSANWTDGLASVPGEAHLFVRVCLLRDGCLSTTHFVDLADARGERWRALSLHALWRVLADLGEPGGRRSLLAARDSRLTQVSFSCMILVQLRT